MNSIRWRAVHGLAVVLVIAMVSAAHAQLNPPHAAYVYPAGGRQGTTFEVTVAGQFLDGTRDVYVSGSGVKAEVVEIVRPLPAVELTKVRDQLKQLREKARQSAWTPEDEKTVADLRQKVARTLRARANPAIADVATLRVKIATDAALGDRELRLTAKNGLSNPLVFCVDQLPEYSKKPAAEVTLTAEEVKAAISRNQQAKAAPVEAPTDITLPTIVNGEIMPGGVDRYRFQARKGQRLVIAAKTRELIPYISDAVPGWFQAALTLYDGEGKEIGHSESFRFQQDPVLFYEVAEDGEYVLQITDSIYRGREDFVYRISMGQLPFVTSMFPLGGKVGERTQIELTGWNLPARKSTQVVKEAGIQALSVREGEWNSNPLPFYSDSLPETMAKEANNSVVHAQTIKLPVVANGRISKPDEWHVFRFEGRAGDEIVAEVYARRLGSPLDSVLKLTDASGKQLAFNDDYDDKAAALITHQADSRIFFKLPAKGAYFLHLGDAQHNGGPEYGYRLRVSYARPDFELRVAPSSVSIRPGLTVPVTVFALRHDGFSGDITLKLKDAPRGFVLSGGRIPAGQDSVRITLGAPPQQVEGPRPLYLEGEAVIGGRKVRHTGVPAEDMMQAFAWHHLVPSKEALVVVMGPGRKRNGPWALADDKALRLPAGGRAEVRLNLYFGPMINQFGGKILLELNGAPEGIAIEDVSRAGDSLTLRLSTDAAKIKPGLKGNLIVDAFMERPPNADGKPKALNRVPMGALPAIPFEVVGR
jgi:hypothetical protein